MTDLRTAPAPSPLAAITSQLERQVTHWVCAAARLDVDDLATPLAWGRLEQYLGIALRRHLNGVVDGLRADAAVLAASMRAASSGTAKARVHRELLGFRLQYLRAETTLDFFADALNTRTNVNVGALLRACDTMAHRAMSQVLDQLGKETPVALTYLDKGLGASILKAGLRLWDGGAACPVAAIKITRHNLLRPTALIHEAGHQVAHITSWNDELRCALDEGLQRAGAAPELAAMWSGWASEIAADAFAFVHTGFASVAALHDVVAGAPASVFRHVPGDPHPISFLRVLLGVACCSYCYGDGPWGRLAESWRLLHRADEAPAHTRAILRDSDALLSTVVRLAIDTPMRAFGGRPLRALVAPERVSPRALTELDQRIGPALFTSAHWLWTEPLRILALTGLQLAARPHELATILERQQQAMLRLGGAQQPT